MTKKAIIEKFRCDFLVDFQTLCNWVIRLAIVIILTSFFRLGARTLNKVWRMSTSSWVNCELVYPSWALEERWPFSMKTLPPPKSMSQSFLLVFFWFCSFLIDFGLFQVYCFGQPLLFARQRCQRANLRFSSKWNKSVSQIVSKVN